MRFNRLNNKHFAELAENNGVFGSAQLSDNNQGVITSDYDQIASLQAFLEGWVSATLTSKRLPPLEEFQGLESYLSYLINYLYQEGTALWNSNQAYFKGSFCKTLDNDKPILWYSKTDNNVNNEPTVPSDYWQIVDFSLFANTDLSNLTTTGQGVIDGKANVDADNFNAGGKSLLSGLGATKPSRADNVTLLASGQPYVAPANGYFALSAQAPTAGTYVGFYNGCFAGQYAVQANHYLRITTPLIKKGNSVYLEYTLGITIQSFVFFYAEGES